MEQARNPLRIGILGAARIAPSAIIYPAQASGHQLLAVASRDKGRAEAFAKQYQVAKTYTSYQDLIDDPQIDVVYNALHNGGHGPWNIRALNAGKHVLSENHLQVMQLRQKRFLQLSINLEKFLWRVFITTTTQYFNEHYQ